MNEKELHKHIASQKPTFRFPDISERHEELKPVVPQFVADWYEAHKDNFEYSVQCLCVHCPDQVRQIDTWFDDDSNKPIETLVMMHKFGYEVKKEKLYTVELPIHNGPLGFHYVLSKNKEGEIILGSFYNNNWKKYDYCQLTEAEIKKEHSWAWKYSEEVKE